MTLHATVSVGDHFDAGEVLVEEPGSTGAIRWAGYTHPLFADPGPGRPVPGHLVLLLLGGLAERSGVFDEGVIALVETRAVRYHRLALAGDRLRLRMEVLEKGLTTSGRRGLIRFGWACTTSAGEPVLDAEMVFLVEV